MTQEDKQLLLTDLCMRLPYGVKVWYKYYSKNVTERFATSIRLVDGKIALSSKFNREGDWYPIEETNELLIKPYLRPMSSMTREEEIEYDATFATIKLADGHYDSTMTYKSFDFLNAHHFDYRGLIGKGLAIAVTENNNPYES